MGGLFGAYMTGYLSPYWCFGLYAMFSIAIFVSGFYITNELETESDIEVDLSLGRPRTCWEEFKHNWKIVKNEFKLPAFYRLIIFFLLLGITKPMFTDYMYFFKLEEAKLTQFQYAILQLVGAIFVTIGVLMYTFWMKNFETRTLLGIAIFIMVLSSASDLAFTLKLYENLGINPFAFCFFTSSTLFPLTKCLFLIPPLVLVAKISPMHVEAIIFSFMASIVTLCVFLLPKMTGVMWNKLLFHIEEDNLDQLYKVYTLELIATLICFCYLPLVPTWAEVAEVQAHLADLNLDAKTPLKISNQTSIEQYDDEGTTIGNV